MDIDNMMPVLDPATSSKSPTTVKNPMAIPPSTAAVGISLLKRPITDSSFQLGSVSCCERTILA